jgi:hypothetical protein
VREHVENSLAGIREALDKQTAAVRDHGELLTGGTGRLVAAGHALLGYLAERDRIVEDERTQSFHELLDAFADGLSAKERRKTSERLSDALERRRNARDADRYRKQLAGQEPVDVPAPPADLAALAGPLAPPRPAKKAAKKAAPAAKKAAPAAKKAAPAPPATTGAAPAASAEPAAPVKAAKKVPAKAVKAATTVKAAKAAKRAKTAPPATKASATKAPAATPTDIVPAPLKKAAAKKAPAKKAAPPAPAPVDEGPAQTITEAPVSGDTGQDSGPSDEIV